MALYKKIGIVLVGFLLLLVVLNFGVNAWIKYRLPDVINEKNNSAYNISYKSLDVSLLNSGIHANEIVLVPKKALKGQKDKAGIYARIKSVDVTQFSIWSVLFSNRIKAKSITITNPEVVLYKKSEKAVNNPRNISSEVVKPFEKIIAVSDIYLKDGDLKIINVTNNKALLSVTHIYIQLDGIVINDDLLAQKIPFSYKSYAVSCDSIYYRANPFYHIMTKKMATTNDGLSIKDFKLIPKYSRREFIRKIDKEKDIYTINAKDITIKKMDWGFKDTVFFLNTKKIVLDQLDANIYRNKIPADDLSKKKLYNNLLRNLKFNLKADTLAVRNSILEYEEEKTFDKGAGKLTFSKFNLTATNIQSGFRQKKLPDLKIKIDCIFMKESPLHVDWTFNVMDKNDGFNIKGRILNFDAQKIVPFVKPYMNVMTKGILNEVYFNFTGNDRVAQGDFAIKYDNLKVEIYRKNDREKVNKVLTALGNLFLKNDSKGDLKSAEVSLERIPEKSFYNFLWRSIAEGLKKILI